MPRRLTPIMFACCTAWSASMEAERTTSSITVLVANRADVPAATLAEMQSEAGYVLGNAGISTTWVDCPFSTAPAEASSACGGPLGGMRFLVRLTRGQIAHHNSILDATLGYARVTPNGGGYATVLMDLVEELAREQQLVSKGQILGHAVAHELGHLLMGTNSHSPHGLMREGWKVNELREMAERRLLFSKEEVERMRARIAATLRD